jgi:dTDP-glucose 4,6-dehydratase
MASTRFSAKNSNCIRRTLRSTISGTRRDIQMEGLPMTAKIKVAVLGANSFSGQDFVDLLLDRPEFSVLGISRSPERSRAFLRYKLRKDLAAYQYHQLDMNNDMERILQLLDAERPEYIVNFAAQSEVAPSWEHPEHWFQTNTVALAKLVNHLRRQNYLKRYLHISSPEAYGSCVGTVTEETPDNPSTPYAASKAAADFLLAVYHKQFGFPVVTVRATNVYGARQQLFKIVPRSVIFIKSGKTIQLHGGGKAVKSYIHIRDVSRGELAILEKGNFGQRYHLSPNQGIAVRDIVELICRRMNKSLSACTETVAERPGQDAAYVIDSTKARRQFGWKAKISYEEGLNDVIDWVQHNWEEISKQSLAYEHKA